MIAKSGAQKSMVVKACGVLPGYAQRLVAQFLEPQEDWRALLSRFLTDKALNDYVWQKPNRRYISQGIYMPSMDSDEMGKVCIAVDTSGSITAQEFTEAVSEVQNALETYEKQGLSTDIHVLYCDTRVHFEETLSVGDVPFKNGKGGGGGTNFAPVMSRVKQLGDDTVALVYLTDGECISFGINPEIPVIWLINSRYNNFNPPFGEVVYTKKK